MTLDEFAKRLKDAAAETGWSTERVDDFIASRFRGRPDESVPSAEGTVLGLRIGAYPVLLAMIELEDGPRMDRDLKRLHAQMVVARSYMRPAEVINAHLLLCAVRSKGDNDWQAVKDVAERNEAVCRKIVWMHDPKASEQAWLHFINRTFLARPWRAADTQDSVALDSTVSLARMVLEEAGLTPTSAARWANIAREMTDEHEIRVNRLVDALEVQP